MTKATLLIKLYDKFLLDEINRTLQTSLKGLNTKTTFLGNSPQGWIQIDISGEDENVALNYLANEVGLCPENASSVQRFMTMKGRIVDLANSKDRLSLDVGIQSPQTAQIEIPFQTLQAQLVDGRKVSFGKIVELFGLCNDFPLTIKVSKADQGGRLFEATLSENQLALYRKWNDSLLDRIIVLGASSYQVRSTLKTTGHDREVIDVESLGIFEHALVCKLGTDGAGLISRIGRNLQSAILSVYNPRRILRFLGRDSNLFTN